MAAPVGEGGGRRGSTISTYASATTMIGGSGGGGEAGGGNATGLSSCLPASVILTSETLRSSLDGSTHHLTPRTNEEKLIFHELRFTPGDDNQIQGTFWWSNHCKFRQQRW